MRMEEMSTSICRGVVVEQAFHVGPTPRRTRIGLLWPFEGGSTLSILWDVEMAIKLE
jgi:hypothetical protein